MKAERFGFDIEIEEVEKAAAGLGTEAWNIGFGRTEQPKRIVEPRNVGKRQFAGVNVQPRPILAHPVQLRKNLAGVQHPFGMKAHFSSLLLVEVDFAEHIGIRSRFRRRRRARR